MKHFIYTAALAAAMACPYVYAQTVDAHANVPFNFRMGDAVMPAGQYRIHESQGLLMLREETGKKAAMHLTLPVSRPAISSNPSLRKGTCGTFQEYRTGQHRSRGEIEVSRDYRYETNAGEGEVSKSALPSPFFGLLVTSLRREKPRRAASV